MPFSSLRPLSAAAALVAATLLATAAFAQAPAPQTAVPPAAGQAAGPQPTPGQLAAARELINVTGTLSTVDDMIPAFAAEVRKQAVTRPDLTKDLEEVLKSLQPELDLQRKAINDQVVATYAKYMSEQDMRDTVAFFKTPSGSKYIKVQPALIDDVVTEVSTWADQASEYLLTRARAEMSKRGHQMQ